MKHLRKILPIIVFSLLFIISSASCAASEPNRVDLIDDGSLYSDNEKQQLTKQLQSISGTHKVDIILYTTANLNGEDADSESLALGSKLSSSNAVTLFISVDDAEHLISLKGYGKAKDYLGVDGRNNISSTYSSYFTNKQYFEGTTKILDKADYYLGKNPKLDAIYYQLWFQLLVSLGIGLVVVLIMALNAGGKMTAFQSTYLDKSNSQVLGRYDHYIRTEVTRTKRQSSSSGGSGSSGSGPSNDSSSF